MEKQTCGGKAFRFVDDAFIAALQADALTEFLERLAGGNHRFSEAAAFLHVLRSLAEVEHPRGKVETQIAQISGATAPQDFDGFGNFIRMASHAAQRLTHIGDERNYFFAHALAGFDHHLREAHGIFFFFHESTGSGFYIED